MVDRTSLSCRPDPTSPSPPLGRRKTPQTHGDRRAGVRVGTVVRSTKDWSSDTRSQGSLVSVQKVVRLEKGVTDYVTGPGGEGRRRGRRAPSVVDRVTDLERERQDVPTPLV